MMKITERGMIFNGEMVRALLNGRKTQTRRIMKVQPVLNGNFYEVFGAAWSQGIKTVPALPGHSLSTRCPFGAVGDHIWVRETWARYNIDQDSHDMSYRATIPKDWPDTGRWRPAIHMPRWASRILLVITDVRIERLNGLSEEDARAEGCAGGHDAIPGYMYSATPHEHFHHVWASIYGEENWQANPWVWVIEFKCIEGGDHATN